MDNNSIKKLETDLWEAADLLRQGSKLTSQQYCMPVLGLLFLRYAYSRFKRVEAEILRNRPVRNGRVMPVEPQDFTEKSALYLPEMAQYSWLVNLPEDIKTANIIAENGQQMNSLGEVVNHAMELVEAQSEQLTGVLPKEYTSFTDDLLAELLRIFNNNALDDVGGDVIGRIYEYFLSKFAPVVASDDGVFFTPKSLVKMIVNILEPTSGVLADIACGSGGMFVQSGDFVNSKGMSANKAMTFYGQEKVEYNAQLCLMNMAVHGLTGVIKSGNEANTFYNDAHNLVGECDYIMSNPPFNVDKVKAEAAQNAGRLPFGLPGVNKAGEIGNANYLWISYFYAYLNETGRAGFVMASSATVVDRTLNEWSEWQLKNLNAIVWLYRGETDKYKALIQEYHDWLGEDSFDEIIKLAEEIMTDLRKEAKEAVNAAAKKDKKQLQAKYDEKTADQENLLQVAKEAAWLYDKFGDGEYRDIPGLCKIATRAEIEEKGWSLTPGAYVGVAPVEDDGVDFHARMAEIHEELLKLQEESNRLMEAISRNMEEMGI